jgi:D-tyrosyl-tRNA(Tyr) deacylase
VVLQRVSRSGVSVDGELVASIGFGFLALVGMEPQDGPEDVEALAIKVAGLRIFPDGAGKMNRSVVEVGGEILVVSQFTLLGDVGKGRRPSFTGAAPPHQAEPLVDFLVATLSGMGIPTLSGVFGADMDVDLVNDGPVTLVLEVSGGRVR